MNMNKTKFNEIFDSMIVNGKLLYVGKLLERAYKAWPGNIAIICEGRKITYEELYKRSLDLAHELREYGLQPRDRVIIFYENSIEFYVAYFAVLHCAGIVAALNTFLNQAELEHIIKDCQPRIIITSGKLLEKVLLIKTLELPKIIHHIDIEKKVELIEEANLRPIDIPEMDPDEMVTLLYTSGTTGFAKGVMLSSRNIMTNIAQGLAILQFTPQDRIYGALPLFHAMMQNTCIWANTFLASTVILVPKIDRRLLKDALTHKPTVVIGVPALFGLFCLMKTLDFSSVKYFFCGGDALPDKIRSMFALVYGRKLCNGFGLTETAPLICVDTDDYVLPTNTVGYPAFGIEIQIRDDAGKILEQGQIGALWVRGNNIMLGYYNAPEATSKVLQDHWFNTGDLAYVDEAGKIVISGREKDLIIQKGVKIYPQEVENILMTHSAVYQAGVVGQDMGDDGQIAIAFVAVRDGDYAIVEKELFDLCNKSLAKYKVPRKIIVKKDLPVTSTGKVDKKVLKKEL